MIVVEKVGKSSQGKRRENFGVGPVRYGVGWGGKGRVPGASSGADRLRTRWRICMPDPASSQTRIDLPALYKIQTLECWLDRPNYKPYNALTGRVATLA